MKPNIKRADIKRAAISSLCPERVFLPLRQAKRAPPRRRQGTAADDLMTADAEVLAVAATDLAAVAAEVAVLVDDADAVATGTAGMVVDTEDANCRPRNMPRQLLLMTTVRLSQRPKATRRLFCRASR